MPSEPKPYPPTNITRSGSKVGWRYYISKEDAEACATAAYSNGAAMEAEGYDFGFRSPGDMAYQNTGSYSGFYEVCVP